MASKRKRKIKGQAPYTKYRKAPYSYQFRNCAHKNSQPERFPVTFVDGRRMVVWLTSCIVCNIIVGKPSIIGGETQFRAEAA